MACPQLKIERRWSLPHAGGARAAAAESRERARQPERERSGDITFHFKRPPHSHTKAEVLLLSWWHHPLNRITTSPFSKHTHCSYRSGGKTAAAASGAPHQRAGPGSEGLRSPTTTDTDDPGRTQHLGAALAQLWRTGEEQQEEQQQEREHQQELKRQQLGEERGHGPGCSSCSWCWGSSCQQRAS